MCLNVVNARLMLLRLVFISGEKLMSCLDGPQILLTFFNELNSNLQLQRLQKSYKVAWQSSQS